ncbi:MAG TPA: GDSL family lipase, partial [Candidatus Fimicola cottocaccae]|nr:GDSL family lipase [Candidatus Fimicola cottocaccae]
MIKTTIIGFGDSLTYGYGVDINTSYIDRLD